MRLRKCDRCNKCYETYLGKDVAAFNTIGTSAYDIDNERIGEGHEYDLCPECQQAFINWYNSYDGKLVGTKEQVTCLEYVLLIAAVLVILAGTHVSNRK